MSGAGEFEQRVRRAGSLAYAARRREEQALGRGAASHLSELRRLVQDPDVRVRRTAGELLRRIAPRSPAACSLILERLSAEADVKTRRRLCAAAGESRDPRLIPALRERLMLESHRYVQASLILALGALGFSDWSEEERARAHDSGPVSDALRLAIGAGRSRGDPQLAAHGRPTGTHVLRVWPGSEDLARVEWDRLGLATRDLGDGWVECAAPTARELARIAELRTVISDFHLAWRGPLDLPDGLERGVDALVECAGAAAGVTFRMGLPPGGSRSSDRRRIRDAARHVASRTGWRNDPSSYDLDVRLERGATEQRLLWSDRRWPRVRRVRLAARTSLHPSLAAALCVALRTRLPGGRGATPRLLDPCCGAGTLLAEWVASGPGAALGNDRSPRALERARRNVGADPRVGLVCSDLARLPLAGDSVDALLVNPPFGIRSAPRGRSLTPLYEALLREGRRVLRPGAPFWIYTARRPALERAAEAWGEHVTEVAQVQAGGLRVHVLALQAAGRPAVTDRS